MNASSIFRVSVLQGGLTLRQHLAAYPGFVPEEAIRQLENGPIACGRFDYKTAHEIAKLHGWEIFPVIENQEAGLRTAIATLAKKLRPFWARMSILGREKVRSLLDTDQTQCLRDARLLDTPPDASCRNWWDDLAAYFRAQQQERMNQIGRAAEELTIAYEQARLRELQIAANPVWVALEDNTLGYDVISYRRQEDQEFQIYIEVKGSTVSPVRFFVTRKEWNTAFNIGDRYFFYIWDTSKAALRIVSTELLSEHIPSDQGTGQWTKAEFTADGTLVSLA